MSNIKFTFGLIKCFQHANKVSYRNTNNLLNTGYIVPVFNKNIRFCSQNAPKSDKQIEKVYYGLLTPQIKAVKVYFYYTSIIIILF